ncbi:MAG: hypothetical protein Q9228_004650, partial [Teloschistes exilis]
CKYRTRATSIMLRVRSRAPRPFSSSQGANLIPSGITARDSQNAKNKAPPTRSWTKAPTETIAALERIPENPSESSSNDKKHSRHGGSRLKYDLGLVHPMTIKKLQSSPQSELSTIETRSYDRSRSRHLKSMFEVYTRTVGDLGQSNELGSDTLGHQSSGIAKNVPYFTEAEPNPPSFWQVDHEDSIPLPTEGELLQMPETTELEDIIKLAESQTTIIGSDLICQLASRDYGLHDFAAWNWILSGKTAMDAVARFELLSTCPTTSSLRFGEIPLFVFFRLLRRQDVDAHTLAILIQQAWRLLRSSRKRRYDTSFGDPKNTNSCTSTPRFDLDNLTIMVVRLLRHSRKVWPASCVNIASLWTTHDRAGLVEPAFELDTIEAKDHVRLAFGYNRILSILALVPEERPYQSFRHRQRAQFMLIRRMDEYKPPLALDREGYRAVTRVQLAHSKTPQERRWASLKAKSWPPWKEDKLGADSAIGVEYGTSRASSSIDRMTEAGYGTQTWEKSAAILAGWDTDGSPTIQTRSHSVPTANPSALWVARVQATRTLQEAWSCFLTCKDQKISMTPHLYHAMFEKLVYDNKRAQDMSRSDALSDAEVEWEEEPLPLPGDGKEVAAVSTWHNEAVSTRQPLPTYESLVERMKRDRIRPSGRFLEFFLKHAVSHTEGIKVLRVSDLSASMKRIYGPPWKEEYFSRVAALLDKVTPSLYAAYIHFICRFACTDVEVNSRDKQDERGQMLRHAFRLVTSRLPFYLPPWRSLLALLAHQGSVFESRMSKGKPAIKKFGYALYLLRCMDSIKLDLDFKGFEKLLVIVHGAFTVSRRTIATASADQDLDAACKMLYTGLSVVKARFSRIVQPSPRIHSARETVAELSDDCSGSRYPSEIEGPSLPRLIQVPHPTALHAYVHFLGAYEDYDGLLDLVRWMSRCSSQIMDETEEYSNGVFSMRRCLTAVRVYVELPLVGYDEGEGISCEDREWYETSTRLVDAVREVVENNEDLAPWPSDEEVDRYIDRAKLKAWTPLSTKMNDGLDLIDTVIDSLLNKSCPTFSNEGHPFFLEAHPLFLTILLALENQWPTALPVLQQQTARLQTDLRGTDLRPGILAKPPLKDTDAKSPSLAPSKSSLINVRDIPAPHCGHIRVISLNSPHNRNAFSTQLLEELERQVSNINKQALLEAKALDEGNPDTAIGSGTRVVIFASDVEHVFCAGADLKERATMSPEQVNAFLTQLRATFDMISNMPVPSISAVCGAALGGGFELALATTFRVFAPTASLGLPETRLGIIPGAGGTYRIQQLVSKPRALHMLLTGRRMSGEEAFHTNLCDRLVASPLQDEKSGDMAIHRRKEILHSAVKMAKDICEGAPASTLVLTRMFNEGASAKTEAEAYERVLRTEDRDEGLKAFREKRKPVFTGRLKKARKDLSGETEKQTTAKSKDGSKMQG